MKTNFKDYLEKKQAQKAIDKIAKEYGYKRIILYGADLFAGDLIRNYDLSKLNVIGVADMQFKDNYEGDYYGYKKFSPYDLLETDFDLLLLTVYEDTEVKDFLKKDLFQGEDIKFEQKTLIKLNLFEYIKAVVRGEV
ncbi:MAG: hypothetical protein WCY19_04355 [Candidatus Gastranaerophilaceae bacterium]